MLLLLLLLIPQTYLESLVKIGSGTAEISMPNSSWWWVCEPILEFSLSLSHAEKNPLKKKGHSVG